MNVLIDVPDFHLRKNNTDWRYSRYTLCQLDRFIPVEFSHSFGKVDTISENINYMVGSLKNRVGLKNTKLKNSDFGRRVHASNKIFTDKKPDIIFSHSRFPIVKCEIPIIWNYAVLDPRMLNSIGITDARVNEMYSLQKQFYESSSCTLVSTKSEAIRHKNKFPEISGRFEWAPFFHPGLSSLSPDEISKKQEKKSTVKILFVGREAYRKGLDILLDALDYIYKSVSSNFELTIVSSMSDRKISLNRAYKINFHESLPHQEVKKIMNESHVFAMPSRFESYGFTFIEAMAAGCVVIAPDWEVQSDILDDGVCGINVKPSVDSVVNALIKTFSVEDRVDLSLNAVRKFNNTFSPSIVANRYFNIFKNILNSR